MNIPQFHIDNAEKATQELINAATKGDNVSVAKLQQGFSITLHNKGQRPTVYKVIIEADRECIYPYVFIQTCYRLEGHERVHQQFVVGEKLFPHYKLLVYTFVSF